MGRSRRSRPLDLPVADYDADEILVVREPAQLKALGDPTRLRIVHLLRERAASATELSEATGQPKGTIAHHLRTLERARLIRVVRTRRVRALDERYWGRVARLFILKGEDGDGTSAMTVRLSADDARRLERRAQRLQRDVAAAARGEGEGDTYTVVVSLRPARGDG